VLGMMSPADCRLPYLPGYGCCSCWVNVGDWQINGSIARHTYTCEFLVKYYIYIYRRCMHEFKYFDILRQKLLVSFFWVTLAVATLLYITGNIMRAKPRFCFQFWECDMCTTTFTGICGMDDIYFLTPKNTWHFTDFTPQKCKNMLG
jgi:hypothetical protein